MNILLKGVVTAAMPGDGISLDAQGVEELRRALNGGGPLTIIFLESGLRAIHGHLPVPVKAEPTTRIENARADGVCSECRECEGSGILLGAKCPDCGGSGKEEA